MEHPDKSFDKRIKINTVEISLPAESQFCSYNPGIQMYSSLDSQSPSNLNAHIHGLYMHHFDRIAFLLRNGLIHAQSYNLAPFHQTSTFSRLSSKNLNWTTTSGMYLIIHHMFQALIICRPKEYHGSQSSTSMPIVHCLKPPHLIPTLMKSFTDIIHL